MRKLITAGAMAAAILAAGVIAGHRERDAADRRRHASGAKPKLLAHSECRLLVRPLSLRLRLAVRAITGRTGITGATATATSGESAGASRNDAPRDRSANTRPGPCGRVFALASSHPAAASIAPTLSEARACGDNAPHIAGNAAPKARVDKEATTRSPRHTKRVLMC